MDTLQLRLSLGFCLNYGRVLLKHMTLPSCRKRPNWRSGRLKRH